MRVLDFTYELPDELIAQTPLDRRSDSRLMVVNPVQKSLRHTTFRHLTDHLLQGDLLVLNNSKVLPARLSGIKADTGAEIELLLTKPLSEYEWIAMAKPAKRLRVGAIVHFSTPGQPQPDEPHASAEVLEVLEDGQRRLRFHVDGPMEHLLNDVGQMPLPPYIHVPLQERDRYQTVYAKSLGSVAAPTAGLHFTEDLLQHIRQMGVEVHDVTLHVGIGTFKPVQVDDIADHVMHTERYEIEETVVSAVKRAKADGRRVIAVGTTALRTLESAARTGGLTAGHGETDIFIYPGYSFRVVDALITNFHLPKSTLLMLVSALAGTDFMRSVYQTAIDQRYRFFSFGDAMFITGRASE